MLNRAFFRTSEQFGVVAAVVPSPAGGIEGGVACRPGACTGPCGGGVAVWVGVGCALGAGTGLGVRIGRGGMLGGSCGGVGAWLRTASARQGRRAVMGQLGQRTLYVLRGVWPFRSSSMSMRLASFSLV